MSIIKFVDYYDIVSRDIYYFGWSKEELANYKQQYQSIYYGSIKDVQLQITDEEENIYYAIFRTPVENQELVRNEKDYLLFKDQNRLLLNVGGKLYRFLIKERKLLNNVWNNKIVSNEYGEIYSPSFHSMSSFSDELMVVVDRDGIAAINWDTILWRRNFEGCPCGGLELLFIKDGCAFTKYENCFEGNCDYISFDIHTGKETAGFKS